MAGARSGMQSEFELLVGKGKSHGPEGKEMSG